ncbi:MAG TPA: amidohydrolase [Saprospiraceae bacterium]|nr:amidohydrolase [Saprospiraceae bacterium]
MTDILRVTIVQADLIWENVTANLQHMDHLLEGLSGKTDLVVLPEMFTTGFTMSPKDLAEPLHGPTFEWMTAFAKKTEAAVTGSIVCREADSYYNRLLFVRPDGSFAHYDKRHLFTLAGEEKVYEPGQENITIEWKGWKIRPQVCYDLRFPVWSRNTNDYDLLFYVANWPRPRRQAWISLLAARAIENQVYCIGVNRCGVDPNGHEYPGDSSVYDYAGDLYTQISEQEGLMTVSLDKSQQDHFRKKLNFLADRDHFEVMD